MKKEGQKEGHVSEGEQVGGGGGGVRGGRGIGHADNN